MAKFTVSVVVATAAMLVYFADGATAFAVDYYVATNGSDTANGTSSQPFRTIQKGIDAASRPGDTVTVASGTYREELTIRSHGTTEKPIIIKAAEKQAAVIDGADRIKGWTPIDGGQNVWSIQFGPPAPYNNDKGRWDMPPRSEQVFVDGQRCTHVKEETALEAMPDYSFTATLSEPARYLLKLPKGIRPDAALTEITLRSNLLNVAWAGNVIIDGLCFRRVRNTYQNAMVLLHGDAIEFRNCVFEYSSAGSGLNVQSTNARIHDNVFRCNGQFGFALSGSGNVLEKNLVTGNDLAGYKEWGTGGTKIVGNANIVRANRFIGNLGGVAIWLDAGPCNNVIERNYVSGNYGEGIRAEISYHNYIGYNVVEDTRQCTATMFGKTQTHCIGISVQNSAETIICNNFLRNNRGAAIQLFAYRRQATDLPQWQKNYPDEKHRQWLTRSWDSGIVFANDNLICNNVIVQTTPESNDACIWFRGGLNGQSPQWSGNQIDHNFYWNSVTHAPKVRLQNLAEAPDGKSQWQIRYGLDLHARGGFSPEDYLGPAFADEYPYAPLGAFTGVGQGKVVTGFPGHLEVDFLEDPVSTERAGDMGHIRCQRK